MLVHCRLYFTIIASLISIKGNSQVTYEQFVLEKDSSRLLYFCRELNTYYLRNSLDTVKIISMSMLSSTQTNECGKNFGSRYIGSYHLRKGNLEKATQCLAESRNYFAKCDLRSFKSETENELGNAFNLLGNYNLAAKFYIASIISGEESSDETAAFNGMIGLGKVFCASGDTSSGIRLVSVFLSKALRHDKFESSADACAYLGMIYGEQGEVELMKAYYRRSMRYAKESKSKTHLANSLNNEAILMFIDNKYDSSLVLFTNALKLRKEVGQQKAIIESYFNIGGFYLERGGYDQAEINFLKSHQMAEEFSLLPDELDALLSLEELYLILGKEDDVSKMKNEIRRVRNLLNEHRNIDDDIFQMALKFEEHAVSEFKVKPEPIITTPIIGGGSLLLLLLLLLRRDRR
ncbi:MAG: tetratricopeptide (TPR) repeat protein [Crocinitomicaceae bacterium]|jgi:tetratricopeptide (TPR) repeat protein